jgi:hypothetical protein
MSYAAYLQLWHNSHCSTAAGVTGHGPPQKLRCSGTGWLTSIWMRASPVITYTRSAPFSCACHACMCHHVTLAVIQHHTPSQHMSYNILMPSTPCTCCTSSWLEHSQEHSPHFQVVPIDRQSVRSRGIINAWMAVGGYSSSAVAHQATYNSPDITYIDVDLIACITRTLLAAPAHPRWGLTLLTIRVSASLRPAKATVSQGLFSSQLT